MQFTRKQIIQYLQTHHTASVSELSKALNLTVGNIRYHIKELESQNAVEEIGNLPAQGRGRPTKLYCLSKGTLNHNLDFLADTLLRILIQQAPSEYADQIATKMIANLETKKNPIQRLNQTVHWLNERHYRSRWEASPSGPRLILGHCPYVAIQDTHPEICQIDARLISRLSGTPMQQTAKLERGPEGSHQCVFVTRF